MKYPLNELLSLSNEEYHAAPGMGSSALRDFITSPQLYAAKHVYKTLSQDDTAALRLGSVVDSIILEPTTLDELVALIPPEVLNKDGHRKGGAWLEWSASQGTKLLVKQDEWDDIRRMVDCVWACSPAIDMLGAMFKQQTVFWQDSDKLLGKCKFDTVVNGGHYDLKTTADPLEMFDKSVRKYKYITQLAWYSYGYMATFDEWPDECGWIVVSKTKPYECMVMSAPDGLQEWADKNITDVLDRYHKHQEWGDWRNPKYDAPVPLNLDLSLYGGY